MMRLLQLQFVRFAMVGATVAVVYVSLYLVFLALGLPRPIANGMAFGLAVTFQYFAQTLFTFRRNVAEAGQAVRFIVMIGFGFVTSAVLTGWIAPVLGTPDWIAATAVAVLLPVQNYILMKLWVYAETSECFEA